MISRWSVFKDHPDATNRRARWSRSAGWLGRSPILPKLLGVATSPRPKWCSQTRLTITRAVSGLSGLAMARARSSRPLPLVAKGAAPSGERTGGNRRGASGPGVAGLPRRNTFMLVGLGPSAKEWKTGYIGGAL